MVVTTFSQEKEKLGLGRVEVVAGGGYPQGRGQGKPVPVTSLRMTLVDFKGTLSRGMRSLGSNWWREEPQEEGLTSWRCQTSLREDRLRQGARDGQ